MTKPKLTLALVVMSSLVAFYSCTTKNETPKPVIDQSAVAALQAQYQELASQVLGAQSKKTSDSLSMTLQYSQLQAAIAAFQKDLQTSVNYSVQVFTYTGVALPGATVKASQGGQVVSATTGANGIATFTGSFYAGRVLCTVDLTGFTRLTFLSDIRNGTDGAMAYSTSSTVLMLPTGGTALSDAAMDVNYIQLYANYSVVDDTLGGPAWNGNFDGVSHADKGALPVGVVGNNVKYDAVTAQSITFSLNQWSFWDADWNNNLNIPAGFTGWNNPGHQDGEVVQVAYEGARWTIASAGSNGAYAIKLPIVNIQQTTADAGGGPYTVIGNNNIEFQMEVAPFMHSYTKYTDGRRAFITTNGNSPKVPTYDIQVSFQYESTWDADWANTHPNQWGAYILDMIVNN